MKMRILRAKEKKEIFRLLKEQWGFDKQLDLVFLATPKGNIYVASREIFRLPLELLRQTSIGLYFGELHEGIRLSIEGSQLVGPASTKNVVELNDTEVISWLKGNDLKKRGEWFGYVLLKHGKDFLGCGKYKPEEGKILNFIPKARRLGIAVEGD
ncbi:MAG: hypothetical protein QXU88_00350 [Candidatus Woesearchaeota archaeon]